MNLAICMSGRNAIGDGYRDIINALPNKSDFLVMIPEGYSLNSFSTGIFRFIEDDVSHNKNRLYKAIELSYRIRKLIRKYNVKNVFIYFDNHWINSLLVLSTFDLNINITCWIHDTLLHDGVNYKDKFIRCINTMVFFKFCKKIIVSYEGAIKEAYQYCNIPLQKIYAVKLPEMLSMEFEKFAHSNNDKKYDFIFFGRLEKYKGIEILLDIARNMNDKIFLVIGKGKHEKAVKEYILKYDNLIFINGYISECKLADYISKSKFALLPYLSATGSQTVQIANYYGVPVIASGHGCFQEYISNYVNGVNIKFSNISESIDKIQEIVNYNWDKSKVKEYLKTEFSINSIVRQISNIMEE